MWLTIRDPGQDRVLEVVGERFVIGRAETCQVVLADDQVSRQHAYLQALPDGRAVLHDLGSTNATFVDGDRVTEPRPLHGNEQIQIGNTIMVTSVLEPGAQATTARTIPDWAPAESPATRERRVLRRGVRTATALGVIAVLAAVALVALFVTGVLPPGGEERTGPIQSISDIVADARRSTVIVEAQVNGERLGTGTGWVLDAEEGLIVTNAHVVNAGETFAVGFDRRLQPAEVVGVAPCEDLAVLRVGDPSGMVTIPLGSQSALRQGDQVIALGYPGNASLADELVVTQGIVSVVETNIDDPNILDVPHYPNVIQTDAAINPGNSGGPLVDLEGRLVGVNSAGDSTKENQGYAIGVDRVKEVVEDLRAGESRAWTGMGFDYPTQESDLTSLDLPPVPGLIVDNVIPGTPAEQAGFGQEPALVIEVGGQAVDNRLSTYCQATGEARTGDEAAFSVLPAGSESANDIQQIQVGFG
jgi:S1-C subfamily serine protease